MCERTYAHQQFRLLIWREKGSMKDVVNLPRWGKAQLVCHWGYLGDYLEGSVSPWCEFGGNVAWELEICSF
jgi:hypothetical protein